MNQPQLSALDFSPEASDLILSLTSEEANELMKTLRPLAIMPEKDGGYPAARLRFLIYGRLRKLAHEAAKVIALLIVFLGLLGSAHAQNNPTIYVDGPEDFSMAITAAINKKHVPVQGTLDGTHADYVLHVAGVASKMESGGSQVARCLFMDCIGAFGSSTASVTLVKANSPVILWSYQVRKSLGGPLGTQSLSEAIAKHLKHDYFTGK
jgi:hypothetical protein